MVTSIWWDIVRPRLWIIALAACIVAASCGGSGRTRPGGGPCGGTGQRCCAANTCNVGGCCIGGMCTAPGAACMGDGTSGTCRTGSCQTTAGAACGAVGQSCCGGFVPDAGFG